LDILLQLFIGRAGFFIHVETAGPIDFSSVKISHGYRPAA